jgi:hypothetical protein
MITALIYLAIEIIVLGVVIWLLLYLIDNLGVPGDWLVFRMVAFGG